MRIVKRSSFPSRHWTNNTFKKKKNGLTDALGRSGSQPNVLYELIVCSIDLFVSGVNQSYKNSEEAGKQSFKVKETSVERYVNVQCCP